MRKTLSLILALALAFSLAAVPAFAADTTEAETSTSDTAYGQLHNGLLSEILSRIDIANDDNFIHGIVGVNIKDLVDHIGSDSNFVHGIVNVDVGDLFKDIASNNNYMHGIITITGNTVNINFGQVIGDIAAGGANSEAAQQALAAGHSTMEEMMLLTIHGILHLLGYDHVTPEQERQMFGLQRQLLLTFFALRQGAGARATLPAGTPDALAEWDREHGAGGKTAK